MKEETRRKTYKERLKMTYVVTGEEFIEFESEESEEQLSKALAREIVDLYFKKLQKKIDRQNTLKDSASSVINLPKVVHSTGSWTIPEQCQDLQEYLGISQQKGLNFIQVELIRSNNELCHTVFRSLGCPS